MPIVTKTKNEWRTLARARRNKLSEAQRVAAGHGAAEQLRFFLQNHHAQSHTISAYMSVGSELPTDETISLCRELNFRVAVPTWDPTARLYKFAWFDDSDKIEIGPMKIPQPSNHIFAAASDIDIFLVPGLVFSTDGKRIGYGGGWYDRLLCGKRPDSVTAGFCYDFQITNEPLPVEPHDISCDIILHA